MSGFRLGLIVLFFAASIIGINAMPKSALADETGCIYQGQNYNVNDQVCIQHMIFTCEEAQQDGSGPDSYAWQNIVNTGC